MNTHTHRQWSWEKGGQLTAHILFPASAARLAIVKAWPQPPWESLKYLNHYINMDFEQPQKRVRWEATKETAESSVNQNARLHFNILEVEAGLCLLC